MPQSGEDRDLWLPDPSSKSYGILIAHYLMYVGRMFSLLDAFIHILQQKPVSFHLILGGFAYALGPVYLWLMARFGKKDPVRDLDLVVFALIHCLVYLYYTLITLGSGEYKTELQ